MGITARNRGWQKRVAAIATAKHHDKRRISFPNPSTSRNGTSGPERDNPKGYDPLIQRYKLAELHPRGNWRSQVLIGLTLNLKATALAGLNSERLNQLGFSV
jgi:hypothetical protein